MASTTVKRNSFCATQETQRQLDDLCTKFGENKSQIITRALQMFHFYLRLPSVSFKIEKSEEK